MVSESAIQDSILSQEWLELDEVPSHFGDIGDVDFQEMNTFVAIPGDESLSNMFRHPEESGLL